jgi:hypothetical protein
MFGLNRPRECVIPETLTSVIPETSNPVIPETVLIGNPAFNQPKFWIPDKSIRG